jgi:hypothetical protein
MDGEQLSLSLPLSLSLSPMGTVNLAATQVSPDNFRTSDFLTKYSNQELQICKHEPYTEAPELCRD